MSEFAAASPASAASSSGSARVAEFREAVQRLRLRSTGRGNEPEYYLFIAGAVLVPLGLLLIILGWTGASQTPNLFEQIPYMISGGLLGVALTFAGGFAYFGYFIARLVSESKAENDRTIEALSRIEELLEASLNGHAPSTSPAEAQDRGTASPSAAAQAAMVAAPQPRPEDEWRDADLEPVEDADWPDPAGEERGEERRPAPRPIPGAKRVRRRTPLSAD